jgi:hypothetical protein
LSAEAKAFASQTLNERDSGRLRPPAVILIARAGRGKVSLKSFHAVNLLGARPFDDP